MLVEVSYRGSFTGHEGSGFLVFALARDWVAVADVASRQYVRATPLGGAPYSNRDLDDRSYGSGRSEVLSR